MLVIPCPVQHTTHTSSDYSYKQRIKSSVPEIHFCFWCDDNGNEDKSPIAFTGYEGGVPIMVKR